jgi:probable rRNA maturation factor
MINISYNVDHNKWNKHFPLYKKYISKTVMTTLNIVQKNSKDDLAIDFLLTSNKNIKKLNYKYRNANKPTNVLSFPMMSIYDGTKFLGDIALALETLQKESKIVKVSKYDYLCKMTAHGMLHLLGYDHETEKQFIQMSELESQILLKIKK